jgi:hypothetical protein
MRTQTSHGIAQDNGCGHGRPARRLEGYNPIGAVSIYSPGIHRICDSRGRWLVRDDVMEATAGRQEPYTYGSLPGEDFFFVATK